MECFAVLFQVFGQLHRILNGQLSYVKSELIIVLTMVGAWQLSGIDVCAVFLNESHSLSY